MHLHILIMYSFRCSIFFFVPLSRALFLPCERACVFDSRFEKDAFGFFYVRCESVAYHP